MSALTRQEEIFFQRVAIKMQEHENLTIDAAARLVCEDDQRIFETVVIMRTEEREAFDRGLSGLVYDRIRSKKEAQP